MKPEAIDGQLSSFKRQVMHIKAKPDWANGRVLDKYLSEAIRAAQTVGQACNGHIPQSDPPAPWIPKAGRLALWNLAR